jgi:hypothetical protein
MSKAQEKINSAQQIQFHKFWVNQVKKELNASYVGWEEVKGKFSLSITLKNIEGVPKKLSIPIQGVPKDTKVEHYKDLIKIFMKQGEVTPKYKPLYDTLTENKELLNLFPELSNSSKTNSWEQDSKKFTELNDNQQEMLKDFDIEEEY